MCNLPVQLSMADLRAWVKTGLQRAAKHSLSSSESREDRSAELVSEQVVFISKLTARMECNEQPRPFIDGC